MKVWYEAPYKHDTVKKLREMGETPSKSGEIHIGDRFGNRTVTGVRTREVMYHGHPCYCCFGSPTEYTDAAVCHPVTETMIDTVCQCGCFKTFPAETILCGQISMSCGCAWKECPRAKTAA